MHLISFDNYDKYKKAQIEGSQRHRNRASFNKGEMMVLAGWHKEHTGQGRGLRIICHGARCGKEVSLLGKRFRRTTVIGTDLYPHNPEKVMEWDFNIPRSDWNEHFHIVYSNSLDHSLDPIATLRTWRGQLRKDGYMYIRWSPQHTHPMLAEGEARPGGDCFGGTFTDYVTVIREAGLDIRHLLWFQMPKRTNQCAVIFCAERNDA